MASAQTEIQFWHAFTGRLGDLVAEQVATFNASQSDYIGHGQPQGQLFRDAERRDRGVPRRRAARHPDGVRGRHRHDDGRRGAIKPVYEVMADAGADLRPGCLYRLGQGLLHLTGRPDAVAAVQLVHAGAVGEPRRADGGRDRPGHRSVDLAEGRRGAGRAEGRRA